MALDVANAIVALAKEQDERENTCYVRVNVKFTEIPEFDEVKSIAFKVVKTKRYLRIQKCKGEYSTLNVEIDYPQLSIDLVNTYINTAWRNIIDNFLYEYIKQNHNVNANYTTRFAVAVSINTDIEDDYPNASEVVYTTLDEFRQGMPNAFVSLLELVSSPYTKLL